MSGSTMYVLTLEAYEDFKVIAVSSDVEALKRKAQADAYPRSSRCDLEWEPGDAGFLWSTFHPHDWSEYRIREVELVP